MDASMSKQELAVKSQNELVASVTGLFEDDEYSDLTIICGPHTFKVHKAVVCPRSDYFKSACRKGGFKEGEENLIKFEASSSDPQADNTGTDDPDAIAHMIHYLYHLDYNVIPILPDAQGSAEQAPKTVDLLTDEPITTDPPATVTSSTATALGVHEHDRSLTMHAKVFAAAVKYGVNSLRTVAHFKFQELLASFGSGTVSIPDIAEAIIVVYATTDTSVQELRHALESELLYPTCGLLLDGRISGAVGSIEGLAHELLDTSQYNSLKSLCAPCGRADVYGCKECSKLYSRFNVCTKERRAQHLQDFCFKCQGELVATSRGDLEDVGKPTGPCSLRPRQE